MITSMLTGSRRCVGAAIALGLAAIVMPSRVGAQTPNPDRGTMGWSYYATGNISPWGFHELALDPTYGAAVGVLRRTETTFEFGLEGLYERLAPQRGRSVFVSCRPDATECTREESSTQFRSEKLQLIGIARLRALHGTLRPYAESSMGVYYAHSRDRGSVVLSGAETGTNQWDYPSSGIGLLLGLGGGLELPVGRRLGLVFLTRLHAQIGNEAARLTPTFGLGVRLR